MSKLKNLLKNHQQEVLLLIGYLAVAGLAFGLGKYEVKPPENTLVQTVNPPSNYNANFSGTQTQTTQISNTQEQLNCEGKIKGSSSLIYHIPGGSFYNKTTRPIRCFETETEAKAAGFRKSSR